MRKLSAFIVPVLVLSCLAMASGCASSVDEESSGGIWKTTKQLYKEYLNTPAAVDLGDKGPCEDYEICLGGAMAEVDMQLRDLQKVMDNSDRAPDQRWVEGMMRRFPWLSGLALTDKAGTPMARFPEHGMKDFNVDQLLEPGKNQRPMALRACVVDSPLGPEIYLGKPVFAGGEFRGLVVAHFDIRSLLSVSKDPGAFMIASPYGLLWPGVYDADSTPVPNQDWADLASGSTKGTVSNSNGTFYWTSSYFANMPLIYALPSEGKFMTKPEQLEALGQTGALAAPHFRGDGATMNDRAVEAQSAPDPAAR